MSIRNRTNLAQIREMTARQVADLPTDQLAILLEETAAMKADAAALADKLGDGCALKYGQRADDARKAENKDTGRVSLEEGDYVIRADLPKKVDWSQPALTAAMRVIRDEWKENPADYLEVKLNVAERKYEAWPPAIRKVFEPARTLGVGKPTYKIERVVT